MKALHIYESLTKKDKKEEIIDYKNIVDSAWSPIIQEAKDRQKISFDLENNDVVDKRIFRKKMNLRIGQPVTSVIPIELWQAGGDWEYPVMYFKFQIQNDHFLRDNSHKFEKKYPWDFERTEKNGGKYGGLGDRYLVIIPPISAGNKLRPVEDSDKFKYRAWTDQDPDFDKQEAKIKDEDRNKAWKWIEKLFDKAIEERYERLDLEQNPLGSDPKDVVPDGVTPADPKDAIAHDDPKLSKLTATEPSPESELPPKLLEGLVPSLHDFLIAEGYNDYIRGAEEIAKAVRSSKKLNKDIKEDILSLMGSLTRYKDGVVTELEPPTSGDKDFSGVSLGADENGWFVMTHRSRSKSYPSIDKIPDAKIKKVASTG